MVHDHSSILRFVALRFGLPALSARDANATAPFEMFDFSAPAHRDPPTLPGATEDPRFVGHCSDTRGGRYANEAASGK